MKKILTIDCDGLCWAVFHGVPILSHEEQGTSIIYGFLNTLFSIQEYEHADNIVFAWDSRKSIRIDIFPEYKIKRRTKKKEYTEEETIIHKDRSRQFNLLRKKILPKLGFVNIFQENGFEGDDIIASVVHKYSENNFIKMIARDGDLYQLLTSKCTMFDHVSRKNMNEENFFEKYGVYPDMWADIKGIAGCTTDEVPGIQGIGTDRAIKYLLGNMKTSSVLYKRIKASPDVIELTRRLVVLPLEGTPQFTIKKDKCTVKKLKKVARKYGLRSYLSHSRLKQFRRYFVPCKQENADHLVK